MILQQHSDQIWTIKNFLSVQECEDLIIFAESKGFQEATVSLKSGARMMKNVRNNDRLVYKDANLATVYWQKLQPFCPTKLDKNDVLGLNEQFRFYRYEENQRFKRHIDGRFQRNESEESRITFMIYLNEDYEGGETAFDNWTIQPQTGMALCFIHELKHEGLPLKSGAKYVLRSDIMYTR